MKKKIKASLARKLETKATTAEEIPQPTASIIDGMSIIQKIKGENLTFDKLSDQLLATVLRLSHGSDRVDVVFYVYKPLSIKDAERSHRGSDTGIRFANIVAGHKIQQWRRLLSCGASKTKLITFIAKQWQEPHRRQLLGSKVLYVTYEDMCTKITSDNISDANELQTSQEEADTRILLHCKHASSDVLSIIIIAEDTDVILLCLAFQSRIDCNMFVRCGSTTRTRFIDITKVATAVGKDVFYALLGMHAYTGCDTVSAFGGRGKVGGLKLLSNTKYRNTFAQLGENWSLPPGLLGCLEECTCRLYVVRSNITEVNEMRFEIFRSKNGDVESGQLPPCRDCLQMHAIRANYQAAIWRRSLEAHSNIPSLLEINGWVLGDDGQLEIKWMTGSPAPDVVLEFLSCKCKRNCLPNSCTCITNRMKCTDACLLQSCENMRDDEREQEYIDECYDDDSSDFEQN